MLLKPAQKGRKHQKHHIDDSDHSSVDGSASDCTDSKDESKISWDTSSLPGSPVKESHKCACSELKILKADPSTPFLMSTPLTASGPEQDRKAIIDKIFDIAAKD